eukprot:11398-Heterococcus_DN1.PRE.3
MAHTVQQSVLNAAPYSTLSPDFNPELAQLSQHSATPSTIVHCYAERAAACGDTLWLPTADTSVEHTHAVLLDAVTDAAHLLVLYGYNVMLHGSRLCTAVEMRRAFAVPLLQRQLLYISTSLINGGTLCIGPTSSGNTAGVSVLLLQHVAMLMAVLSHAMANRITAAATVSTYPSNSDSSKCTYYRAKATASSAA